MNMKQLLCRPIFLTWLLSFIFLVYPVNQISAATISLSPQRLEQMEEFITKQMNTAEIPGLQVIIVEKDKTIYQKGFGYADVLSKKPVTNETLFELGSNSKAFTGLAILQLADKGLIDLNDPVTKYLPWLNLSYKGKIQPITLGQFLYHTSGVPFKSIGFLPEGNEEDALEKTVRTLLVQELNREPGTRYEYATINYDVLGLVIEKVTNQSFETYIKQNILNALELPDTYVGEQNVDQTQKATGYKMGFTEPQKYNPPSFRGNTPAGYIISNGIDIARWMKIQIGAGSTGSINPALIKASHEPDRKVKPSSSGSSYATGWEVYQKGDGELSHPGSNPTFSSFIVVRPTEQMGVAVLANMNSDYTVNIGQGIMNMLLNKEVPPIHSDLYKKLDQLSFSIICVVGPVCLAILFLIGRMFLEVWKKQRKFQVMKKNVIVGLLFHVLLLCIFSLGIFYLPNLLFMELTWQFIKVWIPETIMFAVYGVTLAFVLYFFYSLLLLFSKKKQENIYFSLTVLSIVSGFGNAFIIFIVNEAFTRTNNLVNGLLFYFIMGIFMYVVSQKILRSRLVTLTNQLVYEKRMELVEKLLQTSYSSLEEIEQGRIQATLNNDTEVISRAINIMITCVTNFITLVCCFIYLGIMNFYAFALSAMIIGLVAAIYYLIGQKANKLWEKTRDIQNVFFKFITDMTSGFKELTLHRGKREEFHIAIQESCAEYRDKRAEGDLKFANVFIIGELLFIIVIGCVVFIFPEIFKQMDADMLRNYVFVFLYMTGPVNGLLNGLPQIVMIRISWKRITKMIQELALAKDPEQDNVLTSENVMQTVRMIVKDVSYDYKIQEERGFSVGPINFEFASGEIIFITGGNGSGKSTLAKLLTGLYAPIKGEITINGSKVTHAQLSQYYSAIFGDFHLFDRLYGIDSKRNEQEIKHYLEVLELHEKVKVENGIFSTTRLSTGQKKRLALLITYLEDRPICLFDEWAADQDPEYRRFFYQVLLPDMKQKGKCIIAITHDDQYFHIADKVIKMDAGQMKNPVSV
ncbi:cyclic peptide export ABC transporter [Brevibacillus laterosporus]|uniref:cyclic peptide export ABC transporter n=1 Tax=Brevibacillus laterosporus TaxID=1465 RepID=UPI00215B95BB|nr:cyclic peptide export ABC transporter [Brevibacillus laterosporus]MCR8936164.1 cyclic peptide export ABC transporter [Brevibacillus laterosporus]MCZ0838803.1 cyclic peptide export ABC transporter [Brevibacillus laterosporus]MCZ0844833.1 cyclic peptide export ABC transporter [Brevibacillus laterosporus]